MNHHFPLQVAGKFLVVCSFLMLALAPGIAAAEEVTISAVSVDTLGTLSNGTASGRDFHGVAFVSSNSGRPLSKRRRFFSVRKRALARPGKVHRIINSRLGALNSEGKLKKRFRIRSQSAGSYQFRACISDKAGASMDDSVCGPWSEILIGTQQSAQKSEDVNKDNNDDAPTQGFTDDPDGGPVAESEGYTDDPQGSLYDPETERTIGRATIRLRHRVPSEICLYGDICTFETKVTNANHLAYRGPIRLVYTHVRELERQNIVAPGFACASWSGRPVSLDTDGAKTILCQSRDDVSLAPDESLTVAIGYRISSAFGIADNEKIASSCAAIRLDHIDNGTGGAQSQCAHATIPPLRISDLLEFETGAQETCVFGDECIVLTSVRNTTRRRFDNVEFVLRDFSGVVSPVSANGDFTPISIPIAASHPANCASQMVATSTGSCSVRMDLLPLGVHSVRLNLLINDPGFDPNNRANRTNGQPTRLRYCSRLQPFDRRTEESCAFVNIVAPDQNKDDACSGGRIPDARGECVCPEGQVYSTTYRRCTEPPARQNPEVVVSCDGDQIWNRTKRTCECPRHRPVWNSRSRRCVKLKALAPIQIQRKCTGGRIWNKTANRCACPTQKPVWNAKKKICVRQVQSCSKSFVLDKAKNACVCPAGSTKIGNSCRHKAAKQPDLLTCPAGAGKAGNRCICAKPSRWDSIKNVCRTRAPTCRSPFVLNRERSACVCRKGFVKIGRSCRKRASK